MTGVQTCALPICLALTLDELELLLVGQRAGLTRGARDDDAVGSGVDDVVDVLLDSRPIHLTVGGERRDESDKDLTEGVLRRHALQRIGSGASPAAP